MSLWILLKSFIGMVFLWQFSRRGREVLPIGFGVTYFAALLFGTFKIDMFFWRINPSIIM